MLYKDIEIGKQYWSGTSLVTCVAKIDKDPSRSENRVVVRGASGIEYELWPGHLQDDAQHAETLKRRDDDKQLAQSVADLTRDRLGPNGIIYTGSWGTLEVELNLRGALTLRNLMIGDHPPKGIDPEWAEAEVLSPEQIKKCYKNALRPLVSGGGRGYWGHAIIPEACRAASIDGRPVVGRLRLYAEGMQALLGALLDEQEGSDRDPFAGLLD